MQYLLMIYSNEAQDAERNAAPGAQEAEMGRWFAYTNEMKQAGVLVAGDALHPVSTATSVRVRDGRTVATDGPFAETREQLGGYYLINVADLDEAMVWAEKCPASAWGTIELRPIMQFN